MDEFALIDRFFLPVPHHRQDVVFGIGDDAACLQVPSNQQLLVSTDTLVADVHFCQTWDAYDIAWKAVMVNLSDIAAMGGVPCWLSLALTLPDDDESWLQRFSRGLHDALARYNIALVGGDTTRGPLSMTLTIHGLIPAGKAVRRSGAKPGDKIYLSGDIGAAALAVSFLGSAPTPDMAVLLKKLQHPQPRTDLSSLIQNHATSAIDISDGLSADLNHICVASRVGACLDLIHIPVHPLVEKYKDKNALDFALGGGDDYELCFTVSPAQEPMFLDDLANAGLQCWLIGEIEAGEGLRGRTESGEIVELQVQGYRHF
jgi:thiamine-monophosphate kinase